MDMRLENENEIFEIQHSQREESLIPIENYETERTESMVTSKDDTVHEIISEMSNNMSELRYENLQNIKSIEHLKHELSHMTRMYNELLEKSRDNIFEKSESLNDIDIEIFEVEQFRLESSQNSTVMLCKSDLSDKVDKDISEGHQVYRDDVSVFCELERKFVTDNLVYSEDCYIDSTADEIERLLEEKNRILLIVQKENDELLCNNELMKIQLMDLNQKYIDFYTEDSLDTLNMKLSDIYREMEEKDHDLVVLREHKKALLDDIESLRNELRNKDESFEKKSKENDVIIKNFKFFQEINDLKVKESGEIIDKLQAGVNHFENQTETIFFQQTSIGEQGFVRSEIDLVNESLAGPVTDINRHDHDTMKLVDEFEFKLHEQIINDLQNKKISLENHIEQLEKELEEKNLAKKNFDDLDDIQILERNYEFALRNLECLKLQEINENLIADIARWKNEMELNNEEIVKELNVKDVAINDLQKVKDSLENELCCLRGDLSGRTVYNSNLGVDMKLEKLYKAIETKDLDLMVLRNENLILKNELERQQHDNDEIQKGYTSVFETFSHISRKNDNIVDDVVEEVVKESLYHPLQMSREEDDIAKVDELQNRISQLENELINLRIESGRTIIPCCHQTDFVDDSCTSNKNDNDIEDLLTKLKEKDYLINELNVSRLSLEYNMDWLRKDMSESVIYKKDVEADGALLELYKELENRNLDIMILRNENLSLLNNIERLKLEVDEIKRKSADLSDRLIKTSILQKTSGTDMMKEVLEHTIHIESQLTKKADDSNILDYMESRINKFENEFKDIREVQMYSVSSVDHSTQETSTNVVYQTDIQIDVRLQELSKELEERSNEINILQMCNVDQENDIERLREKIRSKKETSENKLNEKDQIINDLCNEKLDLQMKIENLTQKINESDLDKIDFDDEERYLKIAKDQESQKLNILHEENAQLLMEVNQLKNDLRYKDLEIIERIISKDQAIKDLETIKDGLERNLEYLKEEMKTNVIYCKDTVEDMKLIKLYKELEIKETELMALRHEHSILKNELEHLQNENCEMKKIFTDITERKLESSSHKKEISDNVIEKSVQIVSYTSPHKEELATVEETQTRINQLENELKDLRDIKIHPVSLVEPTTHETLTNIFYQTEISVDDRLQELSKQLVERSKEMNTLQKYQFDQEKDMERLRETIKLKNQDWIINDLDKEKDAYETTICKKDFEERLMKLSNEIEIKNKELVTLRDENAFLLVKTARLRKKMKFVDVDINERTKRKDRTIKDVKTTESLEGNNKQMKEEVETTVIHCKDINENILVMELYKEIETKNVDLMVLRNEKLILMNEMDRLKNENDEIKKQFSDVTDNKHKLSSQKEDEPDFVFEEVCEKQFIQPLQITQKEDEIEIIQEVETRISQLENELMNLRIKTDHKMIPCFHQTDYVDDNYISETNENDTVSWKRDSYSRDEDLIIKLKEKDDIINELYISRLSLEDSIEWLKKEMSKSVIYKKDAVENEKLRELYKKLEDRNLDLMVLRNENLSLSNTIERLKLEVNEIKRKSTDLSDRIMKTPILKNFPSVDTMEDIWENTQYTELHSSKKADDSNILEHMKSRIDKFENDFKDLIDVRMHSVSSPDQSTHETTSDDITALTNDKLTHRDQINQLRKEIKLKDEMINEFQQQKETLTKEMNKDVIDKINHETTGKFGDIHLELEEKNNDLMKFRHEKVCLTQKIENLEKDVSELKKKVVDLSNRIFGITHQKKYISENIMIGEFDSASLEMDSQVSIDENIDEKIMDTLKELESRNNELLILRDQKLSPLKDTDCLSREILNKEELFRNTLKEKVDTINELKKQNENLKLKIEMLTKDMNESVLYKRDEFKDETQVEILKELELKNQEIISLRENKETLLFKIDSLRSVITLKKDEPDVKLKDKNHLINDLTEEKLVLEANIEYLKKERTSLEYYEQFGTLNIDGDPKIVPDMQSKISMLDSELDDLRFRKNLLESSIHQLKKELNERFVAVENTDSERKLLRYHFIEKEFKKSSSQHNARDRSIAYLLDSGQETNIPKDSSQIEAMQHHITELEKELLLLQGKYYDLKQFCPDWVVSGALKLSKPLTNNECQTDTEERLNTSEYFGITDPIRSETHTTLMNTIEKLNIKINEQHLKNQELHNSLFDSSLEKGLLKKEYVNLLKDQNQIYDEYITLMEVCSVLKESSLENRNDLTISVEVQLKNCQVENDLLKIKLIDYRKTLEQTDISLQNIQLYFKEEEANWKLQLKSLEDEQERLKEKIKDLLNELGRQLSSN